MKVVRYFVQGQFGNNLFQYFAGQIIKKIYGYAPKNIPILTDPNAPATVTVRCKNVKLFKLLRENDIPVEFSKDADRFICNALGYYISTASRYGPYSFKTLFVHIPWTTEYKDKVFLEEGKNFLETDLYYKGLELLIRNI